MLHRWTDSNGKYRHYRHTISPCQSICAIVALLFGLWPVGGRCQSEKYETGVVYSKVLGGFSWMTPAGTYPRVLAFVGGVGCLVGRWMLWVGCGVCAAVRPLRALAGLHGQAVGGLTVAHLGDWGGVWRLR